MNSNDSGILAIIGISLSVLGTVLGVINHKRIRSGCCSKKLEVSFDIDNTTPIMEKKPIEPARDSP